MKRQLRPRKSKPSYAALQDFEDDGETAGVGPSITVVDDDLDSASDFAPEQPAEAEDEEMDVDESEIQEDVVVDKVEVQTPQPKTTKAQKIHQGKGKEKAQSKTTNVGPGGNFPRTSKRQMFMLPSPSVHHWHRAAPLFMRTGRVERLSSKPPLFGPTQTTLTNSFTHTTKITDRANKAWGYNVGAGPLWEMVEDRRWFKESITTGNNVEAEAKRRPCVYTDIRVKDGWEVLRESDATSYLPTDDVTTEDGMLKPPPPIACYFGPIVSQTRREMHTLDSFHLSEYLPESKAHVFNAGAPVWGLDWCPIHIDDRPDRSYKQYLAVAPFPASSHSPDIGVKAQRPSNACIQIWSLSPTNPSLQASVTSDNDPGKMTCEMVICVENGPVFELKWCPLPTHDFYKTSQRPRKLGLLAGTFEDGTLCIYVIPQPEDVKPKNHDESQAVIVKLLEPILRIELEEALCWSFDWANSQRIAIGTTNGIIAVYDIGPALNSCRDSDSLAITDIRPSYYLTIHQSAIRALAWAQAPPASPSGAPILDRDPTIIASGGYDGVECLTDIREGRGSIMNRTRDVINALTFSPFAGGPITMDHENTVKAYSASPSMLGRGHTLLEPQGPVWHLHASEYHPQLAVAAADGSCSTSNTLRSTRRGGSVPFFVQKVYQMDYSRKSKEFRMLDRFLPQEVADGRSSAKKNAQYLSASTGAWPREVGIHRVAWNNGNGLGASGLLASATASGLCRVDVLSGRWMKNKVPYGGVGNIRMEFGNDDALDSEESDELSS